MDPRAGLDDVEKREFLTLPGLELRPIGRPARSQSLYRLRYRVPGAFPPGVKRPRGKADHSPPSSAEVRNMWICKSIPPYNFMA
jgi:hypothetical protein